MANNKEKDMKVLKKKKIPLWDNKYCIINKPATRDWRRPRRLGPLGHEGQAVEHREKC